MSEAKKEKTIEELHKEYSDLCLKAGHVQYQIDALERDLKVLNDTRRDINFEAAALNAKANAAKETATTEAA